MKHGAMGFAAALKSMSSHYTLKTEAFHMSRHINDITDLEEITDNDLLTEFKLIRIFHPKFFHMIKAAFPGAFEMTAHGLIDAGLLFRTKANLDGIISFLVFGLFLENNTRTCLNNSNTYCITALCVDSGHPLLFS